MKMKTNIITALSLLFVTAGAGAQELTDSATLSKPVNVAFGVQARDGIASSVYAVEGVQLQQRPFLSTAETLIGRIPGLTVVQSSSAPGAAPTLYLRGRNTYNISLWAGRQGNTPLIIVDGFKGDLEFLSVMEIESVTVLKDAASLALYGQDAANGAILVTTKRGEAGPTRISLNVQQGVMQPTLVPNLLNAHDYGTLYDEARINDGLSPLWRLPDGSYPEYGASTEPGKYLYPDNDYWSELTRALAPYTFASIQMAGGGSAVRYMVSGAYRHNGGLLKYTDQSDKYSSQYFEDRFNIRANLDTRVTDAFSARVDVAAVLGRINSPGGGLPMGLYSALPPQAFALVNPDGSYGSTAIYAANPRAMVESTGYSKTIDRNIDATLALNYDFKKLLPGLKGSAAVNIYSLASIVDAKTKTYATTILTGYDTLTGEYTYGATQGINSDLGWNGAPATTYQRYTFDANLSYSATHGDHALDAVLIWRAEQDHVYNDYYKIRRVGTGLRAHYGYKQRYFAEVTAGYFGGEQFLSGHRFGLFPAGALAWLASEERFIKDIPWIDRLKVRASYGVVGGSSLPLQNPAGTAGQLYAGRIFHSDAYVGQVGVLFGDQSGAVVSSYIESYLPNPDITWEKSHKSDVSVEATLWNNRIDVMFDYFHDRRTGILLTDRYMPAIMGMNLLSRQKYANGGEVRNQGYEAQIGYSGAKKDFYYSVTGSVWYSKNKVVKRSDLTVYTTPEASELGKPVGQNFGYIADGFFPEGTPYGPSADPFQSFGSVGPGDVRYLDMTGDDIVDENDRRAIGYTDIPQYTYAFTLKLGYKNFYLSAMGQGTAQSSMMMGGIMIPFATNGNAFPYATQRWTPATAQTAVYPRLSTLQNNNNYAASTLWLRSTSYFKIRDVEIGYNLPDRVLKSLRLHNARVFLRGNNLLTLSGDIDFLDPESLSAGYPIMRMYGIGISAQF